MNFTRYIIQTFTHYFRLNLTVILGVALSMSILLGAFIIGDSVSYSLQQITALRLGKTDYAITSGERLFRSGLFNDLNEDGLKTCSILAANGMVVVNGGEVRANQVQIWGVDSLFNSFANTDTLYQLKHGEAVINSQLAQILGIKQGQQLLVRANKLSAFPANTPFVSAENNSVSFRVTVKGIAELKATGNFNLQNIQSSPKNIFLSKEWLNQQMELNNKANLILIQGENSSEKGILEKLSASLNLEDLNLKMRTDEEHGIIELISERVFLGPSVEKTIQNKLEGSIPVFTYFVNEFKLNGQSTPYSFVSGIPNEFYPLKDDEIVINRWLADDLQAQTGDSIQLDYFIVGPLRKLEIQQHWFVIQKIVPMEGQWDDPLLMPEIPGLSDAGHCSEWETGIPVDLSSIRPKDEEYWNKYKGTPKAFISLDTAKRLWQNRFGAITAFRFPDVEQDMAEKILKTLSPTQNGFEIKAVKETGLQAASNGIDFSELFIGLSFFVLFAALLLAYFMFKLYLGYRQKEVGNLLALGFSFKQIRKLFFAESGFIILLGILLGIPLGIAYNNLVIKAIGTIWYEIVQTSILQSHLTFAAIVKATTAISIISILAVWLILRKFLRSFASSVSSEYTVTRSFSKRSLIIGLVLLIGSVILLFSFSIRTGEVNPEIFFASGFGLLPALILLLDAFFSYKKTKVGMMKSFRDMIFQRLFENRKKYILLVSFLSIGIFLVLSTGLNRKDVTRNTDQPSSRTGAYTFFAETSFPVLYDLNSDEGRFETGLGADWEFVQFRALSGDDASCLNLNRISRPKVLGFNPTAFDAMKAFTFITKTDDLDEEHPWLSLQKPLRGGQIPAIADETVIKWGLGKSVGDTLVYRNEAGQNITLKLIGGLANSVFQGNLLIDEDYFIQNYPSVSGSQVFLVKGDANKQEELQESLRNYGAEITPAKDRLLKFYQVENTYLNIFLQLGALGLLIGTLGLGIIIFRNLMENRSEFALMKATGYLKGKIFRMIVSEHLLIVLLSIIIGAVPAVVSALPSLLSGLYGGLIYWTLAVSIMVLVGAAFWIWIAGRLAIREPLVESLRND